MFMRKGVRSLKVQSYDLQDAIDALIHLCYYYGITSACRAMLAAVELLVICTGVDQSR
jgi:hypothetical protein